MLNAVVNNGFDVVINYWVVFLFNSAHGLRRFCFDKIYIYIFIHHNYGSTKGKKITAKG